jgi:hypothetical protein
LILGAVRAPELRRMARTRYDVMYPRIKNARVSLLLLPVADHPVSMVTAATLVVTGQGWKVVRIPATKHDTDATKNSVIDFCLPFG